MSGAVLGTGAAKGNRVPARPPCPHILGRRVPAHPPCPSNQGTKWGWGADEYKTQPINAPNDRWQETCQRKEQRVPKGQGRRGLGAGGYNFKGGGVGRPPIR